MIEIHLVWIYFRLIIIYLVCKLSFDYLIDVWFFYRILPHIKGNVGFVFTRSDLVEVREKLLENKVQAPARAGAIAPCPVVIPAQNTGLGPEKTSFFQALSIPTKISKGTIEIIVSVCVFPTFWIFWIFVWIFLFFV